MKSTPLMAFVRRTNQPARCSDSDHFSHSSFNSILLNSITPQPPPDQCTQIGVRCSNIGFENIFVIRLSESVGHLRRHALHRTGLEAEESLNYGLFLPGSGNKKGKFLEDERPIADYPSLYRTYTATSEAGDSVFEQASQGSPDSGVGQETCWVEVAQNHFMDLVLKQDIHGIEKLFIKGFDPNFWSKKNGEAPITAAATCYHPRELIVSLVNGGAHINFRARDSQTALHKAAICGNYEAIKTLLDLGQNPNCRDWKGLTPLYYAVSTDISARCTHALLYDHAILGVQDENGFQEIHQACRANRVQHLENLLTYGADLNARTRRSQTPLHVCVTHEAAECLRQLLLRGADPIQTNDDNQTPLEYAML